MNHKKSILNRDKEEIGWWNKFVWFSIHNFPLPLFSGPSGMFVSFQHYGFIDASALYIILKSSIHMPCIYGYGQKYCNFFQETLYSVLNQEACLIRMKFKAVFATTIQRVKSPNRCCLSSEQQGKKKKKNDSGDLCIYVMGTCLNSWYSFLKINDMDIL